MKRHLIAASRIGRLGAVIKRYQTALVASWFIVLSAVRIIEDLPDPPGFDSRLYRAATAVWLGGGNPWTVDRAGVVFAAPPPSMLPFVPLVAIPEDAAVAIVMLLGFATSVWVLRRLGLGLWWLAFPPLVDALWNGNSQIFLLPLLVAGLEPLAVVLKVYALAIPILSLDTRRVAVSVAFLAMTVPILPWSAYVSAFPMISANLAAQSRGGMSISSVSGPAFLVAAVVATLALLAVGRERAKWLVVPVAWPSTQWYYGSIAIPALSPLAGAIFALPIPLAPLLGTLALLGERWVAQVAPRGRPAPRKSSGTLEP